MQAPDFPPPIYVVSGGVGASGEQLVQTVLAQFPENKVPVVVVSRVHSAEQVQSVVERARASGGAIAHTLVDTGLRVAMRVRAKQAGVIAIDLMGPLLTQVGRTLKREPLGQPGLYRELHRHYYERVEAIEYSMAHDDGMHPSGWGDAEIVLSGVSRTGKTPLSIYLSVLGWKVANIPIVPDIPVAKEFYELDRHKVIGLTIEPGALVLLRRQRQIRLGAPGPSDYVDPPLVFAEVQTAVEWFKQLGMTVIDVTDKPIETTADEIIRLLTRRGG